MSILREEKNKIRNEYLEKRNRLNGDVLRAASEKICSRISALASYRYADTVLLYCPVNCEVDILHLIKKAHEDGKKIAFPRCNVATKTMSYHFIESADLLKASTYGIPEPPDDAPMYDIASSAGTLCIIPAIVFDRDGYRLGYGGGYYDRFLSDFRGARVGAIMNGFIIDKVPRSRYDTHVDALVTEKGVLSFYAN